MAEALVKIEQLHFSRGGRAIFSGIDLSIARGKITAVMGPSGTGKTTLLKLIGAQLRPESGSVHFAGENVHQVRRSRLFALRRQMGLLFQSGALFTDMSVFDNVAFPLRTHTDLPEDMIRDLVLLKLECVGLRAASALAPTQLSGGMARRVALARAIALDPELIMYDEPFAGQDPISMGVLIKLIEQLSSALRLTSIIVSHDVAETLRIADYVYLIADAKLVAEGSSEQIRAHPSPWVQQFLNAKADGPVRFHMAGDSSYAHQLDLAP